MKQALRLSITCASALAALLALAACKSEEQKQAEADMLISRPLTPLDPTDKFSIGPWWSDGRHLLNLTNDGFYALYDSNNRYSRPMDRGSWSQFTYGTLWLQPYGGQQPKPTRVEITRVDGQITLLVPHLQPMHALASPPTVGEDGLIGAWQGAMGSLQLNPDMTYVYTPAAAGSGAEGDHRPGAVAAGHNGRWHLDKDRVTLSPLTPSVQPVILKVRQPPAAKPADANAATQAPTADAVLDGMGGELARINPAST